MGFFGWLFGGRRRQWGVSERGNATLTVARTRITVFPSEYAGWKYCIADIEDHKEPYFSEAYETEQAAREEALAHLNGKPGRHPTLSAKRAVGRKGKLEAVIAERELVVKELHSHFAAEPDIGLTALRKLEARITSHLKGLSWQIPKFHRRGVAEQMISLAERQQVALARLADHVRQRIAAKEAQRKPRTKKANAIGS